MKLKYDAETARRKKLKAASFVSGAATYPSLMDLGTGGDAWSLYHHYRTAFKLGDPADEVEHRQGGKG